MNSRPRKKAKILGHRSSKKAVSLEETRSKLKFQVDCSLEDMRYQILYVSIQMKKKTGAGRCPLIGSCPFKKMRKRRAK